MIKAKYYKVAMKANKQQWQVVENRRGGEELILQCITKICAQLPYFKHNNFHSDMKGIKFDFVAILLFYSVNKDVSTKILRKKVPMFAQQ